MAVLAPPIFIHGDCQPSMAYIQNSEKIVSGGQTAAVMRYIQSHCIEDVMSVGYNGCSGLRELAAEQFRLSEAAYKSIHSRFKAYTTVLSVQKYLETYHKKKLPRHLKPDENGMIHVTKEEVTGVHLIISVHKEDRVSPAKLQKVLDEFMRHPYFRDFYALSNIHANTDELHGHIVMSNFSKDGGRKLALSGTKVRELRRYLDRICYEHGISIIDSHEARLDPEHATWIDEVKKEGKVTVREEKKNSRRNWKSSQKAAAEKELERIEEKDMPEPYKELAELRAEYGLFFGDGRHLNIMRQPKSQYHYYVEQKVYVKGQYRTRSLVELLFELARVMLTGDTGYIEKHYPDRRNDFVILYAKPDEKIQRMMDSIAICRELNCRWPEDLKGRVDEIGKAIGATKRAIRYDEKTLERSELYEAVMTWQSETATEDERSAAYAVLAAHRCTSLSDMQSVVERQIRAQRRLPENQKYLEDLKRSYRELSNAKNTLENLAQECVCCRNAVIDIANGRKVDITAQIKDAEGKTSPQSGDTRQGEERER